MKTIQCVKLWFLVKISVNCSHTHSRLEEFKKLNAPVDLVEGAEIEMTVRGDTLHYKNATGGVGTLRSRVFTTALCDVFYGSDAVSPTMKAAVVQGIAKL